MPAKGPGKTWETDVKRMNTALAKEGIEHSIIEAYSPKRVTGMAELMGLVPGMALDFTTDDHDGKPWDFNIEEKRERAMSLVKSKKALLIIGSPMCSAFSQLQNLNFCKMSKDDIKAVQDYGRKHLEFCMELYRAQHDNGLYFLHEHPFNATSWQNEMVKQVLNLPGVSKVKSHMCAFGMTEGNVLVKKPTGFMTNASKIGEILQRDCSGDHRHVVLLGGRRAKRAEVYPGELCKKIIFGLRDQMIHDGRLGEGMIGAVDGVDEFKINHELYNDATFFDDISGKKLPKEATIKARQKEMTEVYAHNIYTKCPIQECYDVTGTEPVGTKWLEVNKGDEENLNIRARLVAQEFNQGKLATIFAATPPLEAKKALLSLAVTEGIGWGDGWHYKLDFIDIKRAYFYAPAKRDVYVKLPIEDYEEGYCGKLNKSMYGTRDASLNWENEYIRFMLSVGFVRGLSSPCLFYHPGKDIRAVVYGDDFTLLGAEEALDWFKAEIQLVYAIDFKARLGPEKNDQKSVRLLNRVIEWTAEGINIEGDQRHAEIIIKQLGLEEARSLSSPGERIKPQDLTEDDIKELSPTDATIFRAVVARGNYLSIDRSDTRFAIKELARRMAKPRNIDYKQLIHFGRYLAGKP